QRTHENRNHAGGRKESMHGNPRAEIVFPDGVAPARAENLSRPMGSATLSSWPRRGQDGRAVGIAHPKLKTPQLWYVRRRDIRANLHQQQVLPLPQPDFRTVVVELHPGVSVCPM